MHEVAYSAGQWATNLGGQLLIIGLKMMEATAARDAQHASPWLRDGITVGTVGSSSVKSVVDFSPRSGVWKSPHPSVFVRIVTTTCNRRKELMTAPGTSRSLNCISGQPRILIITPSYFKWFYAKGKVMLRVGWEEFTYICTVLKHCNILNRKGSFALQLMCSSLYLYLLRVVLDRKSSLKHLGNVTLIHWTSGLSDFRCKSAFSARILFVYSVNSCNGLFKQEKCLKCL